MGGKKTFAEFIEQETGEKIDEEEFEKEWKKDIDSVIEAEKSIASDDLNEFFERIKRKVKSEPRPFDHDNFARVLREYFNGPKAETEAEKKFNKIIVAVPE
jgi:hypothetical protein